MALISPVIFVNFHSTIVGNKLQIGFIRHYCLEAHADRAVHHNDRWLNLGDQPVAVGFQL